MKTQTTKPQTKANSVHQIIVKIAPICLLLTTPTISQHIKLGAGPKDVESIN